MNTRLIRMISILAVVSLLAAGSAFAEKQYGGRDWQKGPPSVEERLARISAALDLSGEQSLEMLAILQEQEENKAALHEQMMEIMGPEICAQRAQTEEAILGILTAEQTELYLQIREDRQGKSRKKGRGGNGNAELDCSD